MKNDIIEQVVGEMEKEAPKRWDKVFLDLDQPIPDAPPYLAKIGDTDIIFRQGITAVSGIQKAGKTSWVRLLLAAILCGKVLEIEAVPDLKAIVFDCEQPIFRILAQINKAFTMAGKNRTNQGPIKVAALRQYSPEERLTIVKETIADLRPDIAILDGITDLLQDPNDLAASGFVVGELLAVSQEFDCGLVVICHTNPNPGQTGDKLRGHIGSELMRKCETSIGMTKVDGIFTCRCKDSRGRPFSPFSFTKDDDDNITAVATPTTEKPIATKDRIFAAMEPGKEYTTTELQGLVDSKAGSARSAIHDLCKEGRIISAGRGVYKVKLDDR